MQETVFYFDDYQLNKRKGRVIIRAFEKSPMIEFDVYLNPIPADEDGFGGKEVTVNFQAYNFTHNGKFYTDSNGLEMQERIKDFRQGWDLQTNQSVSANYYPVNQAIAIVDEGLKLRMTVMNDRSQGGSVID